MKRPRASPAAGEPDDDAAPAAYSSPACYMHELDPPNTTGATPKDWPEIRDWRKRTRESLIAARMSLTVKTRQEKGERIKQKLLAAIDLEQYPILGVYWPMRGEIDVRDIARQHIEAGGTIGLPVVVEKAAPVEFWKWQPGMGMKRGIWNIPVPMTREVVIPDALIVPLVGFDHERYRLGYGGGYYDRTIAASARRPFCAGIGFAEAELPTIYPQPHDIPMHLIVTDR